MHLIAQILSMDSQKHENHTKSRSEYSETLFEQRFIDTSYIDWNNGAAATYDIAEHYLNKHIL